MKPLPLDGPPKILPSAKESAQIIALAEASTNPHRITRSEYARAEAKVIVSPHKVWIVSQHQQNAWAEVFSAAYIGLELAVACTTTQLESGGRMVYGSDPGATWMEGLWGHQVTKVNYQQIFLPGIKRGEVSNGVGIKQLTSPSLIYAADARGGAWNAQHNCAEGDAFFLALIRQTGSLWMAFYAYNGSGPAAQNYANMAIGIVGEWRQRLA
jgi:hypothetical protein